MTIHARRTTVSFIVTIAVVLSLVFAVPVRAVSLNLDAPATTTAGNTVQFELELDIADGERIPIRDVTLVIHRPDDSTLTCTFDERGLPLGGCDEFVIGLAADNASYAASDRYGDGWNGTAFENTSFGFGYGHGAAETPELAWDVIWNTDGEAPGAYEVEYYVTAEDGSVTREYRMVTLEATTLTAGSEPSVSVEIKEWYPKGNNFVFVCDAENFSPNNFDWYFGDGHQLEDSPHQDVYHTYVENGSYIVTCVASDGVTTESDSRGVTVGAVDEESGGEDPPEGDVCYSNVNDIPATCDGGVITQDGPASGCREITCTSGSSQTVVLACDKPDSGTKQYFEMYKQAQSGEMLEICLGDTCIAGNGFARSDNYPVCTGDGGGETPPPPPPEGDAEATVSVAPWFPKERDYVFQCDTEGFSPNSYDWYFGDGAKLVGISNDDVYHSYSSAGDYTVTCVANGADDSATDTLDVTVS